VEEMDDKNYITNSVQTRDKFNKLLGKIGQETYADNTIQKAFKGIVETTIMRKTRGRGTYQVNPLYYFKGTEEERQKTIREQLEEWNKIPINKHRKDLIVDKAISSKRKAP